MATDLLVRRGDNGLPVRLEVSISDSWQIDLILYFQHWPAWWLWFMKLVTELGRTEAYLLFVSVCYWCFDGWLGLRLGLLLPVTGLLNDILKFVFHLPRPFWLDSRVAALDSGLAFGAPSGHAMSAAAMWTGLAAGWCCWWGTWLAVILIALIGLSRVFLGVHSPLQVLAGWALGLAVVYLWLKYEARAAKWLDRAGFRIQVLLSLAAGAAATVLSWTAKAVNAGWQLPRVWAVNAASARPVASQIEPFSRHGALFMAGVLTGVGLGAALLYRRGWFSLTWSWPNRLARFLIGVAGTIGVLIAAKLGGGLFIGEIFGGFWLADYTWLLTAGVLIGLWVAWGAPLVFIGLKLARRLPQRG